MKTYLLAVHQPDGDPPPPEVLDPIIRGVQDWEGDLKTAGAWVFTAGLAPAHTATTLHRRDGEVLLTDGPYPEGKEHLGGFTVIRVADLDAALDWGRRLAEVVGLPIELRPFAGD